MWWLALLAIPVYLHLRPQPSGCARPIVSSRVNLHTHSICLAPGTDSYITTKDFGHTHRVILSDALTKGSINAAGELTLRSSVDSGHSHDFTITPADAEAATKLGHPEAKMFDVVPGTNYRLQVQVNGPTTALTVTDIMSTLSFGSWQPDVTSMVNAIGSNVFTVNARWTGIVLKASPVVTSQLTIINMTLAP